MSEEYDPTPFEFRPNPDNYRGMSREEAKRQMEEDERRAINEDPRTKAGFARLDRWVAEQEAEEKRLGEEERREREAEAAAEWEREKEHRRRLWVGAGGAESEFEEAWPELRKGLLMERMFAAEVEREARGAEAVGSIWRGA